MQLENVCPTAPGEVLSKLSGNWELLWTTQDRSRQESRSFLSWINPLENQSYSNNPRGRADPFLPQDMQEQLERAGLVANAAVRSTQSINVAKNTIQNVVSFQLGSKQRASLMVSVAFKPNPKNPRQVDVKFQACRVILPDTPVNVNFPLGIVGPTGWLVTNYIDDSLRITRGHKGSVFILKRL